MSDTTRNPLFILKKIVQKSSRILRRQLYANRAIKKLESHDDVVVQKMGRVLKKSLKKDLTQTEQEIVDRVEGLRASYKSTSLKIDASNENDSDKDDVSHILRVASKSKSWLIFQLILIREFKVMRGLEFGTCLGISASYQAAAIKLNGGNDFVTMEGLKSRHEFSENLFKKLNIDNVEAKQGDFKEVLPKVLDKNNKYDYMFLDGDHRYESTINYFETVLPYLKEHSIVILDDIRWSDEMERAWEEVRNHDQVIYTFDFERVGVCIVGKGKKPEHFKLTLW